MATEQQYTQMIAGFEDGGENTAAEARDLFTEFKNDITALKTQTASAEPLFGAGAPASGLGVNGQTYTNTVNGYVYKKVNGAWVYQYTAKGKDGSTPVAGIDYEQPADGEDGADGNHIFDKSYAPTAANTASVDGHTVQEGDQWFYTISLSSYERYAFKAGQWRLVFRKAEGTTVTPPADTTAPNLTFTAPASGATVNPGQQLTLTAVATDNVAVTTVTFLNGSTGATIGAANKNGNTYTLAYTVPAGQATGALTLQAQASDAAGNVQTASITLSVQPATLPKLSTPTGYQASATSSNAISATLSSVANATSYVFELATDSAFSQNVQAVTQSGTTKNWSGLTANTTYYTRAKAQASGYQDSDYASATATTQAAAAVLAAGLTLPNGNTVTVGSALAYSATASGGTAPYSLLVQATNDATGVVTQVYSGAGASYSGSWTPTTAGNYSLTNTVTDAVGASKISTSRPVTVSAAPVQQTTLTPTLADYHYNANILRTNSAGQNLHAAFSALKINLSGATTGTLNVFSTGGSGSVLVLDGATSKGLFGAGANALTGLSGGTLTVVTGGQQRSYEQGDVQGADVSSFVFPAGASGSFIAPAQTVRAIAIPGDSISNGALLTAPQREAWTAMLRGSGVSTTLLGYGSGTASVMFDPANWTTHKARLHTILDGATEQVIAASIGTNDYGGAGGGSAANGGLSPADFQTRFRTWLQNVTTEFPAAKILVITPFYRTDESSVNSYGATLQAYRDAETSAAAGIANVTVRSGTGILIGSDLIDGVHPNAGGHLKILNFVQPEINNLFSSAADLVDMAGLTDASYVQLVKATVSGTTISKASGTPNNFDGGAVASFRIGTSSGAGAKGQVQFAPATSVRTGSSTGGTVFGVSTAPPDYSVVGADNAPANYYSLSASFYFDGQKYGLIEANQPAPFITYPWPASGALPVLDILVTDSQVKYYANKKLLYTSAYNPVPNFPLYIAVALSTPSISAVAGLKVAGVNLVSIASTTYNAAGRYHDEGFSVGNASGKRYSGTAWTYHANNPEGDNGGITTGENGAIAELDFTGTSVALRGNTYQDLGAYELYLKAEGESTFTLKYSGTQYESGYPATITSKDLYTIGGLSPGNYTVRLVARAYIVFDGFVVT